MPIYVYRREDGSTFEIQQRITDDPLEKCPDTGQAVKRVITGAGLVFKGDGFYITDYARKKSSPPPSTGSTATSTDSTSSNTETKTTSTKPEKSTTSTTEK